MRVGLDWNQIFRKDTEATISSTVYVCKQKQMKYKVCIKVSDDEDTVMNNNNVMVDHHLLYLAHLTYSVLQKMNLSIIKRDINSDVLITELFFYKIMPLIYIYVKKYKI